MADVKVSALTELLGDSLDPEADSLLVSDMSVRVSKRMKPVEFLRASILNRSSVYDFTTGSLGPSISFTRASTGWYRDSAGAIAAAFTDVPRFAYDPVALTPRGLLIEQSVTNQFAQSDAINDAGWTKTRTSVPVADGFGTMDKLVEDTNGSTHSLARNSALISGTVYCVSALAKAAERNWIAIVLSSSSVGGAGTARHYFDVGNGVLGSGSIHATEFIEHVGGGVYRCSIIWTSGTSTTAGHAFFELAPANVTANYTGDGASGLFLGGLSITDSASLTSPVLTTTAGATRAADVARIANPAALIDQCWIVKGRTPRKLIGAGENVAFQVDDRTGNNARTLIYGLDGVIYAIATVGGVITCFIALGAVAADTDFAVSVRWADNNFAASLNGGAIVTDVSGSNPLGLTTARIGSGAGTGYWNSTIKRIETRRTASNAELPTLSV